MNITLNGKRVTCPTPLDIQNFLDKNGFADKKIAVALNGSFVPRSAYIDTALSDGDEIEVVAPMQGG